MSTVHVPLVIVPTGQSFAILHRRSERPVAKGLTRPQAVTLRRELLDRVSPAVWDEAHRDIGCRETCRDLCYDLLASHLR